MKNLSGKYINMKLSKNRWMYMLVLFFGIIGFESSAQTLDEYLQMAAENNPELRSAYAQFEAALQQAPQVASLEDPTLTVSAFGRMIETRLGAQEARFTFMQMFPWFGTLKAKGDASDLRAEAKFQEYLDLRNRLFFEIKSVYAELYEVEKTIELSEDNLEILDSYRDLSLSQFRSGNAPMVNVVKVDIQRESVLTEILLLEDLKKPLETELNLMLNRNPETTVAVEDTLRFNTTETFIVAEELENHPSLRSLEKQRQSYEVEQTVAQKEGMPMVGLGVDYSIISKRTDANPQMNGQDAIMPMLSVTLPIFRKKYRAARKEAGFMEESMQQEKEAVKNELKSTYEMTIYELKRAERQITLYDKQLESSDQANELLISAFGGAISSFEEILQMNQDILMFRTQKIEAIKNGFIAEARLEYLLSKNE